MACTIASLSTAFQAASSNMLLSNSSRLKIGIERGAVTKDDHSCLLLGPEDKFPGFKGTISTIWRVKKGLSVSNAGDRYIFRFDRVSVRNQVLHGGSWHYNNTMLVLGLGRVIRFDPQALKRKEEIQRIRLEFDVHRVWQEVEFEADEIVVELDFTFEKEKARTVGSKRKAVGLLERTGKRFLNFPEPSLNVAETGSVALVHHQGQWVVSPKKKKNLGCPYGSENKTKTESAPVVKKWKSHKKVASSEKTTGFWWYGF
ncbi:hypothetical protein ACLB2K_031382 [Fragaria x ananassa]